MDRSNYTNYSSEEDDYLNSSREITPAAKLKNNTIYAWGKPPKHCTNYKMLSKRKLLPIWQYKDQIVKMIRDSQVIIFDGETGLGKSTQIPLWGLGMLSVEYVVCVPPRRIAAISSAQRVAQEMGVKLGQEVGYAVRFDHCADPKTVLNM